MHRGRDDHKGNKYKATIYIAESCAIKESIEH